MIDLISLTLTATLTLFSAQAKLTIDGQINDYSGKPAKGVRVCAFTDACGVNSRNLGLPCGRSDQQGRFTINVDKPGQYKLFYDDIVHGFYAPFLPYFRHPTAAVPEVFLDEVNNRASVTISMLKKNGVIAGKIVDRKTELPVEDVEFIMCHAANPEICWRTNAKDSSGSFSVPAPHVPFTFRIKAAGYDDWIGPDGADKETAIDVEPETKAEFAVFLKRSASSAGRVVNDGEKEVGVNLPAPIQWAPKPDAVVDHFPRQTELQWSPIEGAASYTVEVDFCDGELANRDKCVDPQPLNVRGNRATTGILTTTYSFQFVGAQPGRWRVWAVDEQGREGFRSPWRRFVYLR